MKRSERLVRTIEHGLYSSEHPSASIECGVVSSFPTPAGAYSRCPESRAAPNAARLDALLSQLHGVAQAGGTPLWATRRKQKRRREQCSRAQRRRA